MNNKKLSVSSKKWLKEHFNDKYVKLAKKNKLRSRAYFKIEEIQRSDRIFKPKMHVIDLGAAPGGWSQFASSIIGEDAKIVACDLLKMDPILNVEFIQGDFCDEEVLQKILNTLNKRVDVVMSDMAPNFSGNPNIDIPRSMYLCELALDMAKNVLKPRGTFLVKVFQGEGFNEYYKEIKSLFNKVKVRKPDSSRSRSREVYILGLDFKSNIDTIVNN